MYSGYPCFKKYVWGISVSLELFEAAIWKFQKEESPVFSLFNPISPCYVNYILTPSAYTLITEKESPVILQSTGDSVLQSFDIAAAIPQSIPQARKIA